MAVAKRVWLDAADWKRTQKSVPIACVDVLPLRVSGSDAGLVDAVGLIRRDTPHQGRRWCLVGGRLLRNETLTEAVARQVRETLGRGVRFDIEAAAQPAYVAQYFTFVRHIGCRDPRQHAVAMTFCVAIKGTPVPQGEAESFEWHAPTRLPPADEFGFDQDRVVKACLAKLIASGIRLAN